jgi:hypothetical protein
MSEVKVNKISPRSGTNVTLGDNGDTITIPSGVTFDASSGGLAGTLTTAAQPNITSVGTLTSFTSTGIDDNATSTAITISSAEEVTFTSSILLGDGDRAKFGASQDLQIFHDGTNSKIQENGTGQLILDSNGNGVYFTKSDSEYMAKMITDGAVELYYDNSKKFETTSGGATVTGNLTATGNLTSTGIDDNATSTAITIDSSQNVSFNDDTGNTAKMVWNATDESLKINVQYGDYYVAYLVPQLSPGGVTTDLVLLIGEKDVNQIRITGRFYTPSPYPVLNNRNAFSVDILYQQWNSQLPRFTYDAMHTGSRASHADNMELAEVVYDGTTYYAINIQANTSSLGGQPIYFTGGITNTTDLGWVTRDSLTSYTAVTPSSNDTTDKRINAENIRFKNEKNEDKMLITTGGDISFYEDTGTTPQFFWDASTERLGIGTSSPTKKLHVVGDMLIGFAGINEYLYFDSTLNYVGRNTTTGHVELNSQGGQSILFSIGGTEKMRIDNSGNVGIGATSITPRDSGARVLELYGGANGRSSIKMNNSTSGTGATDGLFMGYDSGFSFNILNNEAGIISFGTSASERMRIASNGIVLIGKTAANENVAGVELNPSGVIVITRPDASLLINRLSTDGVLVYFNQAGTTEGNISVSGSTVSYNGFTGTHWSRFTDNSTPNILRGTVLETLDEMCDWYNLHFDITTTTQDEDGNDVTNTVTEKVPYVLTDSQSNGDVITYNHEGTDYQATIVKEADIKHMKSKVSDTVDAKNVYGVFVAYDEDGEGYNDFYVASVGSFVVRIKANETIAKGDLLQSNGDGTAKVQSDDAVRSSSFAKVLSTTIIETYEDGSYLVPCSLMC